MRRDQFSMAGMFGAAAALVLITGQAQSVAADDASVEALDAVVQLSARIPADARTAGTLGMERDGTGVVIDQAGLILTIGYLILEADQIEIKGLGGDAVPANVVAYDHESGLGLVRAGSELDLLPIEIGDSDELSAMQPLLAVSEVDELDAAGVYLVDRRTFAGYWEYLLEDAIFTTPPHRHFGGAALIDRGGRLVGIGSLFVPDAAYRGRPIPGNMFIPINQLKPILGDLLAKGRRSDPPRPWLGAFFEEHRGRVFVTRVAPDGPADEAGLREDDLILGVGDSTIDGLADFYRKLWSLGPSGVEVPLDVIKDRAVTTTIVPSSDRYRYLRLDPSY